MKRMRLVSLSLSLAIMAGLGMPQLGISQPSTAERLTTYVGLGLSIVDEFALKDRLAPARPRVTNPGAFDASLRSALKWRDDRLKTASDASDALLYFGTLPSVFWTPFLSERGYEKRLLINLQVLAINGFLTSVAKYAVGRQRPSAHFGTWKSLGADDNLSFYSGHTSYSFAAAVSTAYMLSEDYPEHRSAIWTAALSFAAATGYLRVAADLHYVSDVLAGAIVGSAVGYLTPRLQLPRYFTASGGKNIRLRYSAQW